MLTVSNGFKEAIKKLSVFSDAKVDIISDAGTLSFTKDEISKIDIFGSAYQKDTVLGTIAQHSLTLEILGDVTKQIALNKENVVQVQLGVLVDSAYEYVQYQDFLIVEITYSDTTNLTKIIGTDNLIKLNHEYVDNNVYPMTLKNYLIDVLTDCGLELENDSFFNDDFSITAQPFNNFVNAKEIVSRIAELALCFVKVNKDTNKIELVNAFSAIPDPNTHDDLAIFTHDQLSLYEHNQLMFGFDVDIDNATKDNYWDLKLKDNFFGQNGINTLVLRISQVEGENNSKENSANVAIDGAIEINIVDNPFINSEAKRLSVIDNMFSEIDEYKYQPFSLEYRGFPYLEIGDILIIEQMDKTEIAVPILECQLRYDGGLYGRVSAQSLNPVTTSYKYFSSTTGKIRNAEILVDKVQGEITSTVNELNQFEELVQTQFIQTSDSFNFKFSQIIADYESLDQTTKNKFDEIIKYIRFIDGKIVLGEVGNELTLEITNEKIAFLQNGFEVAYITDNILYIEDGNFLNELRIGAFAFTPRANGSLQFKKVGI